MFCKPHHLRSSSRTGDALLGDERTEDGVTSDISSREGCLGGQGFVAPQSRTATNKCKQGESVFLRTCCMRWHELRRSLSQRTREMLSVLPLDIDHACWQILLWSAGFCGICPWQWPDLFEQLPLTHSASNSLFWLLWSRLGNGGFKLTPKACMLYSHAECLLGATVFPLLALLCPRHCGTSVLKLNLFCKAELQLLGEVSQSM